MPRILLCIFSFIIMALPALSLGAGAKVALVSVENFDEKGLQLKTPEGIACNDKQMLIVADTGNGRLLRYSYQDGIVKGGTEIVVPQLSVPTRVQIGAADVIYVLDGKLRKIGKINADGSFAGYLDPLGVPEPSMQLWSFKLDAQENIYLLDTGGARVVILDKTGKFLRQLPFPKATGFMSDVAIDSNGSILLIDSINAQIFIAAKETNEFKPLTAPLHDYIDFPIGISTDAQNRLYVLDQNGHAVILLGTDGSFQGRQMNFGLKNGFLNYPAQLCINRTGDLFIADRSNNRFQYFKVTR